MVRSTKSILNELIADFVSVTVFHSSADRCNVNGRRDYSAAQIDLAEGRVVNARATYAKAMVQYEAATGALLETGTTSGFGGGGR